MSCSELVPAEVACATLVDTFVKKNLHDEFDQAIFRSLQESYDLFTRYRGKAFKKIVNQLASFEVVEQGLHGNSGAAKHRSSTHDIEAA